MATPYKITPRKMTTIREVRGISFSSEAIRLNPPPSPASHSEDRPKAVSKMFSVGRLAVLDASHKRQEDTKQLEAGFLVTSNLAVTYERGNPSTA